MGKENLVLAQQVIHLRPKHSLFLLAGLVLLIFGCGDGTEEKPEPAPDPGTTTPQETGSTGTTKQPPKPPVVYVEEVDQFQEYFKEQHDTSFSHVRNKNWTSFKAGKAGVLTRIRLYGKPHFATSDFYGSEMNGIIRADNPDSGPKLAEWNLSRADIVSQLAEQGLSELDYGWIDVRMLGEAILAVGKTYYMVCERISDGKHWFGAFAFSEGDSYKDGRHWLHPEHDLVFRTYVGQVESPDVPPSPDPNPGTTPIKDPSKERAPAPIPQKPQIAPKPTTPPEVQPTSPEVQPTPPQPPPAPTTPPGPPKPRLRSLPLPQDQQELDPGEDDRDVPDAQGAIPLPPPIPSTKDPAAAGEKNETKRRRLLPGLFRPRP